MYLTSVVHASSVVLQATRIRERERAHIAFELLQMLVHALGVVAKQRRRLVSTLAFYTPMRMLRVIVAVYIMRRQCFCTRKRGWTSCARIHGSWNIVIIVSLLESRRVSQNANHLIAKY